MRTCDDFFSNKIILSYSNDKIVRQWNNNNKFEMIQQIKLSISGTNTMQIY